MLDDVTSIEKKCNAAAFDPSGRDVLAFALAERRAARKAAIITLVDIDGSSPREIGAQMAVAEDGRSVGSISSGCLERAIIEEARAALERGAGGVIRYGKGSKYLDVVLPCGSGVDVLYTVDLDPAVLDDCVTALDRRAPQALDFSDHGATLSGHARSEWLDSVFTRAYQPRLRIVAAGAGAELIALSRVASASGYAFCAISPETETLEKCATGEKHLLQSAGQAPDVNIDPWTAFIFLFHDREWELALAPRALDSSAFYVGAVGSRKTHSSRLEVLRGQGVDEEMLTRLDGPIGLLPRTRDPSALAVSVLAGVLSHWPHP